MEYPLVSVVIPVYNMEPFLGETLDSVLASDYPSLEVVVLDDGSVDASYALARQYAEKDGRVHVYTQLNMGVSAARNRAISLAKGEFILPVDADNKISREFIHNAVNVILQDEEVKVVSPRAEFFGNRSGEWKLPPFSLKLLARKNIMDTCALYRKSDWERVGGYNEDIIAREDWEFWIALLKDGGKVIKLPDVSLYYRVRSNSKRMTDRSQKKHVINVLNQRHPDFFERELGGPLRYRRTWSQLINKAYRLFHPSVSLVGENYVDFSYWVKALPFCFGDSFGSLIYKGRNELREYNYKGKDLVIKSFAKPNLINRIVYGLGGPLRYRRTWSQLINKAYRLFHPSVSLVGENYVDFSYWVKALPFCFGDSFGSLIYKGRNELREYNYKGKDLVIKSFAKPNLINRIVYGLFRSSKAQRSYEYADMLLKAGIGTPEPVGYCTERIGLLFTRSYYISLKSECPYVYYDLIKKHFDNQEQILRAIARTTATMHDHGYLHKDYSRGNILFRETGNEVKVEIIDLNRIRFMEIGMEMGCKNFERLPGTPEMFAILADEYAKARGFEADECLKLMLKYNSAML